jgi:hypothetical protein
MILKVLFFSILLLCTLFIFFIGTCEGGYIISIYCDWNNRENESGGEGKNKLDKNPANQEPDNLSSISVDIGLIGVNLGLTIFMIFFLF